MPSHNFTDPPVVETLLGIQFDPIPKLSAFEFPGILSKLGLTGQILETPGLGQITLDPQMPSRQLGPPVALGLGVRARLDVPSPRRRVQLENGWLTLSWIKDPKTAEPYPRYLKLQQELAEHFSNLARTLGEYGDVRSNAWEFSYVNAIHPVEAVGTWTDLMPGIVARALPAPTPVSISWRIEQRNFDGRIDLAATAQQPSSTIVRITAQGRLGGNIDSWQEGIRLGHDAALELFVSSISDKAKALWGYSYD